MVVARAGHVAEPSVVLGLELGHAVRLLSGQIVHFQRIVGHVVQLELGLAVPLVADTEGLNELPILAAGGEGPVAPRHVAAVPLETEHAVGPGARLAAQQRR